jgi:hypothetical protein
MLMESHITHLAQLYPTRQRHTQFSFSGDKPDKKMIISILVCNSVFNTYDFSFVVYLPLCFLGFLSPFVQ